MMWFVLIGLLIIVVTLRYYAVMITQINRDDKEMEKYVEEYIRNSEHSED